MTFTKKHKHAVISLTVFVAISAFGLSQTSKIERVAVPTNKNEKIYDKDKQQWVRFGTEYSEAPWDGIVVRLVDLPGTPAGQHLRIAEVKYHDRENGPSQLVFLSGSMQDRLKAGDKVKVHWVGHMTGLGEHLIPYILEPPEKG